MVSVLTNNGAMKATQALRRIDVALTNAQASASTGLTVRTARDNAAIWSVASTMRSDMSGLAGARDSIGLGNATTAIAREAAETAVSLLGDMKERIALAQSDNADRLKIDADVQALKAMIGAAVDSAQFNGFNLLEDADPETMTVVTGLNRRAGGVDIATMEVARHFMTEVSGGPTPTPPLPVAGVRIFGGSGIPGSNGAQTVGVNENFSFDASLMAEGDVVTTTINGVVTSYVVTAADSDANVFSDNLIASFGTTAATFTNTFAPGSPGELRFHYAGPSTTFRIEFERPQPGTGGLSELWGLNVRTKAAANAALAVIDPLIDYAASVASHYGAVGKRILGHGDFALMLGDSLKSGVGALVDADMERVSAALLAAEVSRDLAIQSLSISNARPQLILTLFA